MKENKYDDNIFFQKYSQMSRSQQGLAVPSIRRQGSRS